jgi:hypothetical protein
VWFLMADDYKIDMDGLQAVVELLGEALLGERPTFAIPWSDPNANPINDVQSILYAMEGP